MFSEPCIICVEHCTLKCSMQFGHLWISVMDFACYRKEVLRCGLRTHITLGPSCPASKYKVSWTAVWQLKRSWWPHKRSRTSLFVTGAQFRTCGDQALISQQRAPTATSDCLSHLRALLYSLPCTLHAPLFLPSSPARLPRSRYLDLCNSRHAWSRPVP